MPFILVPVLLAFYIQGALKFKCQIPVPKGEGRLNIVTGLTLNISIILFFPVLSSVTTPTISFNYSVFVNRIIISDDFIKVSSLELVNIVVVKKQLKMNKTVPMVLCIEVRHLTFYRIFLHVKRIPEFPT
jgi:hypothetical protein